MKMAPVEQVHLVVFDVDGTLTRSSAVDAHCYGHAVSECIGLQIDTNWSRRTLGLAVCSEERTMRNRLCSVRGCDTFQPQATAGNIWSKSTVVAADKCSSRSNRPSEKDRYRMISRHWRGLAKFGHADEYVEHLRRETFPHLSGLAGFVGASILKRETEEGTEFLVVTTWESIDAIARFAGQDVEDAVVPAKVQELMLRCERRALHYEVVE